MGCDIHSFAEVRTEGKWQKVTEKAFGVESDYVGKTNAPFDWRSYSLFAFLAGVRNYDHCEPISEPRGLPDDSEYLNKEVEDGYYGPFGKASPCTEKKRLEEDYDYHSKSWLTLKELLEFDYDKTFWNRRITRTTYREDGSVSGSNGACIAEEGEGTIVTYREKLGV